MRPTRGDWQIGQALTPTARRSISCTAIAGSSWCAAAFWMIWGDRGGLRPEGADPAINRVVTSGRVLRTLGFVETGPTDRFNSPVNRDAPESVTFRKSRAAGGRRDGTSIAPASRPGHAAAIESNNRLPPVPPISGSTRFSGCGIRPRIRRLGLRIPAIERALPLRLAASVVSPDGVA
jgi:hypothetical protein